MIKKIFCLLVIIAAIGLCVGMAQEEKESFTADRHKSRGLGCVACHKEEQPKTAAPAGSCLACHKSLDAVAERTKDYLQNPHSNHITDSSEVQCTQCHQGHKADTILCHNCHAGMKFEKKPAESN